MSLKLSTIWSGRSVVLLLLAMLPLWAAAGVDDLQYQEQSVAIDGAEYRVHLPRGYQLELLTSALETPRLMTFSKNGDLFIGSRSGRVYRLAPPYRQAEVLLELDDYPHSVAVRDNEILIARTHGLYRAEYLPGQKALSPEQVTLLAPLPGGAGHNSRTVAVGPDGRIYVSLGISGNCSDEYLGSPYNFEQRRGGILVLDEEGEKPQWRTFASGLRNPVGFDWHPHSAVMYASNNGPDHLGYELPPEYFSSISPGSFHGMPWFQYNGEQIKRDDCIRRLPPRPAKEVSVPVATFPARNAPMGVAFVPTGAMDAGMQGDAVVALRGSWGTQPSGGYLGDRASRRPPALVLVRFDGDRAVRVDDLVTGFQLQNGERWARPVGVAMGPDGALYFTSDAGINGLFKIRRK